MAYEHPETDLPVVGCKNIAINYLIGWVWIDLAAIFPTQEIEKILQPSE